MQKITETTYVDKAEQVIKELSGEISGEETGKKESCDKKQYNRREKRKNNPSAQLVTTSKIRNLLSMTADIYNEVLNLQSNQLDERLKGRIEYLRIRYIYEAGRDEAVKNLITKAEIPAILKEINGSKKNFILFNHYIEALVAFRKFYGKKDE